MSKVLNEILGIGVFVGFVCVLVLAPRPLVFAVAGVAFVLACATRSYAVSRPSPLLSGTEKWLWCVVVAGAIYTVFVLPRLTGLVASAVIAVSTFLAYRLLRGFSNANPTLSSFADLLVTISAASILLTAFAIFLQLEGF
jgi:hypothetical protein